MRDGDSARYLVWLLIGALCAAALLLIGAIAGGSDLGDTGGRALATVACVALLSLTGAAGMRLTQRQPRLSPFGYLTALISLVAFLGVTAVIWNDGLSSGDGWRMPAYALILALGAGHASLLLGSAREEDREAIRVVRMGVLLAIALLCLLAIVEISHPGRDIGARPIAVVAILYALGSLVLPLLRRLPNARVTS